MVGQPALEVVRGHPGAPPHLQQLGQVELVHRDDDEAKRQVGKAPKLRPEHRRILVLQRVVKHAVPVVDLYQHVHGTQIERDDGHQQAARFPFFFRIEVRHRQGPDFARLRLELCEFDCQIHENTLKKASSPRRICINSYNLYSLKGFAGIPPAAVATRSQASRRRPGEL